MMASYINLNIIQLTIQKLQRQEVSRNKKFKNVFVFYLRGYRVNRIYDDI